MYGNGWEIKQFMNGNGICMPISASAISFESVHNRLNFEGIFKHTCFRRLQTLAYTLNKWGNQSDSDCHNRKPQYNIFNRNVTWQVYSSTL